MSNPKERRGPYAKTALQRAAILDIALDHFGDKGYHGASMREISRLAGLSQAGLLYHFSSKAELLTAILDQIDLTTTDRLNRLQPSEPLMRLVNVVNINANQRNLIQLFTTVSIEATSPEHPAHDFFQRRFRRLSLAIEGCLEQAIHLGQAKSVDDTRATALTCLAMMQGLYVLWLQDVRTDIVGLFRQYIDSSIATSSHPTREPDSLIYCSDELERSSGDTD